MKKLFLSKVLVLFFVLVFLPAGAAYATTITYDAQNLGGNRWEYTYTVLNDTTEDVLAFTVFFDYGLYDNLLATSTPTGWDAITWNPELIFSFPDDGAYDAQAMSVPGIAPNETLGGFSVAFDWLGNDPIPGAQYFETYDPAGFAPIPEPTSILLLSFGLLGLAGLRKKFKN